MLLGIVCSPGFEEYRQQESELREAVAHETRAANEAALEWSAKCSLAPTAADSPTGAASHSLHATPTPPGSPSRLSAATGHVPAGGLLNRSPEPGTPAFALSQCDRELQLLARIDAALDGSSSL